METEDLARRIEQLELAVSNLSKRTPGKTGQITNVYNSQPTGIGVQLLSTPELIIGAPTATGGYVTYNFTNVPNEATVVLAAGQFGNAAIHAKPTVYVNWRAESTAPIIPIVSRQASSVAGDFDGYGAILLPVTGASGQYEVSSDWTSISLYAYGYFVLPVL
jgi:hypothetical protein